MTKRKLVCFFLAFLLSLQGFAPFANAQKSSSSSSSGKSSSSSNRSSSSSSKPPENRCGVTADGAPFCGADGTGKTCSTVTDCYPRCKIAADGRSAQCAEDGNGKTCFDQSDCIETACQQSADGKSGQCVVGGRGARCNPAKEGATGDVCKDKRCSNDGKCVYGGYGKPCKGVAGECPKSSCAYLPEPDGTLVANCADGSKSALTCKRNDQPGQPDFKGDCPDEPKLCIFDKKSGSASCRLLTADEKAKGLPANLVAGSACGKPEDCNFHVCQEGACVKGGRVGWKGGVPCDPAVDTPGRCGEKRCNGYSCSVNGQGMRCDGEADCSFNACLPGYFYKRGGAGGVPPGFPTPDPNKPEDQDKLFCIIVEGNAPDQCGGTKKCPELAPMAPESFGALVDENKARASARWDEDTKPFQSETEIKRDRETINQYVDLIPETRFLGSSSAPVLIVMFQDLKCGMCKSSYDSMLPEVRKNFVETGKARLLLLDYPLGLREIESRFAQAARCAEDQNSYHEYIAKLYADMKDSNPQKLVDYASSLSLETEVFEQCLTTSKYKNDIEKEFHLGTKLGVNGTPTFFVNGVRADGAISYERMASLIEKELEENSGS